MAQRRGIRFNNSAKLLTEHEDRLAELRGRVDELAADLEELEGMTVRERREASELRSSILQKFKRLGRF